MPTRKPVKPRTNKRQEILDAALRLFAERGYSGTAIEDIGAAVDITGPGVYRHFSSKEEILTVAFEGAGQLLADGLEAAQNQPPDEALRTLVRSHATMAVKQGRWIRIWLREGHRLPQRWSDRTKKVQVSYISSFAEVVGAVRPDLSESERTELTHAVLGLLNNAANYRGAMPEARRIAYLESNALAFVASAPTAERGTSATGSSASTAPKKATRARTPKRPVA